MQHFQLICFEFGTRIVNNEQLSMATNRHWFPCSVSRNFIKSIATRYHGCVKKLDCWKWEPLRFQAHCHYDLKDYGTTDWDLMLRCLGLWSNQFSFGLFFCQALFPLVSSVSFPYLSIFTSFLCVRVLLRGWKADNKFSHEQLEVTMDIVYPFFIALIRHGDYGEWTSYILHLHSAHHDQ